MCGIVAVLADAPLPSSMEQSPEWAACMTSLARRGPDGSGTWRAASGCAVLGHTRLSIVDPTDRGAQPMIAREGTVAITYNGEIYNAPELRERLVAAGHAFESRCDTEVVLRGWLEWGRGVLDELLGMYAFAIWDDQAGELFAAVDHAGMKPLFWCFEHGRLHVTSDADSMLALTDGGRELDPTGFRLLLTLGCCPPPHTVWAGVNKLPPGTLLSWRCGERVRIERHWVPHDEIDDSPTDPDSFSAVCDEVMRGHMLADVPVGAFLSGGLDSAVVVAGSAACGTRPECFTLSMHGDDDESADARQLAARLGLPHTVPPAGTDIAQDLAWCASAYDEPQGYSALLNAVRISELASGQVRAVIGGDGGDEAFGGYLWQRESGPDAWQHLPADRALARDAEALSTAVAGADATDEQRAYATRTLAARSFLHAYMWRVFPGFHPAEATALTASLGSTLEEDAMIDWLACADMPRMPHIRRVQRLDLAGFCGASILPKIDRAGMHFGLEVRAPLLDRRMLRLGLCAPVTPGEECPTGDGSRPALRTYLETMLGKGSASRKKQGFSLRVPSELTQWRAMAESIDRGVLVRTGALRPDWRSYVPLGHTPRLRLIAMVSAWADQRLR